MFEKEIEKAHPTLHELIIDEKNKLYVLLPEDMITAAILESFTLKT